jgi:hypothetical protein
MARRYTWGRWTAEDEQELVRIRAAGVPLGDAAARMGRTSAALLSHWNKMTGGRPWSDRRSGHGRVNAPDLSPRVAALRESLARARMAQAPVSALLGEPPPGFSALDRKRAAGG